MAGPDEGSFWRIYARTFTRPGCAMDLLLGAPHALRHGLLALSVTGCTYLAVYFFLWQNGGRPTVFEPWLAIEPEVYYRYNLLLHIPSLIVAWLTASGLAQLGARALGGTGSFEGTLSVLGLGIGVATWTTGLHDVLTTFLGYIGVLNQRAYEDAMNTPGTWPHRLIWLLMSAYLIAFLWLFTRGIQAAHRLSPLRALGVAAGAFCTYQVLFVVVNR